MSGKIFVSYRRDDDPNGAARVRDALAAKFGKSSIFMDVDNLLAGLRFDDELTKALASCDVFIAIIGTRWLDLLKAKAASGERDFVCEEISGALKRKIAVMGEMLELGPWAEELHRIVGSHAAAVGVTVLIGISGAARHLVDAGRASGLDAGAALFFETSAEAGTYLRTVAREGDAILFKGSRGTRVELALEVFLEGR